MTDVSACHAGPSQSPPHWRNGSTRDAIHECETRNMQSRNVNVNRAPARWRGMNNPVMFWGLVPRVVMICTPYHVEARTGPGSPAGEG